MYKERALNARKKVLEMVYRARTSHIASNFSVIDIATVLYANLKSRDEVVWSCGWKAATIYYFLAQQGKITESDLDKFPNAPYFGLAEPTVNGIHVAGGSMGHGLPVAVGMALAKKKLGQEGTIFCIMSDGEMNEGTTWESAMVASHHNLDNLVILVDKNNWQAMGKTEDVLRIDLPKMWDSFGFDVSCVDGHNFNEIETSVGNSSRPKVVICETIKGKGISFMENHLTYHYKHVSDEDYREALKELV
jgi:transketolase